MKNKAQQMVQYDSSPSQVHGHGGILLTAALMGASCCLWPACVDLTPPWEKVSQYDGGATDTERAMVDRDGAVSLAPCGENAVQDCGAVTDTGRATVDRDGAVADTSAFARAEVTSDLFARKDGGYTVASGSDGPRVPAIDALAPDARASGDIAPTPDALSRIDAPSMVMNISRGKLAMASAEQDGKEAIYGNDGVIETTFCNESASFPAWWRVDLGATFDTDRADITFESPTVGYQYRIEVSDNDVSYTTVVDQSASATRSGPTVSVPFRAHPRYVRITLLGSSSTDSWPCLREFSVWGYPARGASVPVNLAPSGTAYRWYGNTNATSNANRIAEPNLNDESIAVDVSLSGKIYPDLDNAYEAAGVVFPRDSLISSVVFINGDTLRPPAFFPGDPDGNFASDLHLQFSFDGTTWTDRRDWALTPAYPYDATVRNRAFVFSGAATKVKGVRVTGLVHPDRVKSAYARVREVQVWGPSAVD